MKDGLWNIVNGTETAPSSVDADRRAKFATRRDRALATIVLSVEPSLLYLLGDPEDQVTVWQKLANQFEKKTWAVTQKVDRTKSGPGVQLWQPKADRPVHFWLP